MKKLITTLALTAVCVGAFAQGKVTFVNDANHYYYMSPTLVKPADAALAGQLTPSGGVLPSGVTLRADLYAGLTAGSMVLYSSTTLSSAAGVLGRQNTLNVTLNAAGKPQIPGGAPAFFQVQIRDAAYGTADLSGLAGSYVGYSSIFTVNPSSTIAFNSIVNAGGTALSTWAVGSVPFANAVPAGFGAISVGIVPEPTSMVLAGLGAASLLLFRRKK